VVAVVVLDIAVVVLDIAHRVRLVPLRSQHPIALKFFSQFGGQLV
jgi:hypothetical protein